MRLSSVQIFQQGINAILTQQSHLQHTQQQLSTGKRLLTPADDPAAAVQILALGERLSAVDQYQANADLADAQLSLEEDVLAQAGTLLQRVRELVIQANNATQSAETRRAIGVEIETQIDALVALANTRDAAGEYIFAGFQSHEIPFARQGGSVVYNGDDGRRSLQIAPGSQVAVRDSGASVFQNIPRGNGDFVVTAGPANTGTGVVGLTAASSDYLPDSYTITFSRLSATDPVSYQVEDSSATVVASGIYKSGDRINFAGADIEISGEPADGDSFIVSNAGLQDIFTTLQTIADVLRGGSVNQINNVLSEGLVNLDQAANHLLALRADIGVRLNILDGQRDINDGFTLQLQQTLSDLEDLNYVEAISRFNLQLVALQAAQQSYIKTQGLSLFNFL